MSNPFIGEIRIFGFNFAPRGWAFADGQTMQIASNTALFSLFGTIYGGDGRVDFGIPDLRGRVPINSGGNSAGPGLSIYRLGQRSGANDIVLTDQQLPQHNHTAALNSSGAGASSTTPEGNTAANTGPPLFSTSSPGTPMHANSVTIEESGGGSQTHSNIQPYLAMRFCVSLAGTYPSRS